jgi:hypothetical protein
MGGFEAKDPVLDAQTRQGEKTCDVISQVQCAKDCKSAMSILKGAGYDSHHM